MIAANSKYNLLSSGKVVVEIEMGTLNDVVGIFRKENFRLLKVMNDLVGISRTLIFGLI
jgi:methylase of polypeptide subunit release factors